MQHITRTVWIVSLISLLTDVASEMLYPIMPIYLQTIGFSVIYIGLLEGFAEATAGLSKGFFGRWSDVVGRRMPFIRAGYLLSALSKPLIVAAAHPLWVFVCRTADRLGKGVRTAARDALLSDESGLAHKGKVFGFHRGMDTFGAAIGPALALLWLWKNPGRYQSLFVFALIPGLIATILTLLIKDKPAGRRTVNRFSWWEFPRYYAAALPAYRKTVNGLLLFTLFNSSDVFLLLMGKLRGISDQQLIVIYIIYNLIYAIFSYPMGRLGDAMGLKNTFLAGLTVFIAVYLAFGLVGTKYIPVLFFFYGVFAAMTEGISKAWISNLCDARDTATALGTYQAFASLASMLASFIAGLLWKFIAPEATFLIAAAGASLAATYLAFTAPPEPRMPHNSAL